MKRSILILLALITLSAYTSQNAPHFDYERLALPPELLKPNFIYRLDQDISLLDSRDIKNLPIIALHRAEGDLSDPQTFSSLKPILTQCQRYADVAISYLWQNFCTNISRRETRLIQHAKSLLSPLLQELWRRNLKQRFGGKQQKAKATLLYKQTKLHQLLAKETFHADQWKMAAVPDTRRILETFRSKVWDAWPQIAKRNNREFYNWALREIQSRDLTRDTETKELIIENGKRIAERSLNAHSCILNHLKKHVIGTKLGWLYDEAPPQDLQTIFAVFFIHKPNMSRPLALICEKIIVDCVLANLAEEELDDTSKIKLYRDEQAKLLRDIRAMIQELLSSKIPSQKRPNPEDSEESEEEPVIIPEGDDSQTQVESSGQAEDESEKSDI